MKYLSSPWLLAIALTLALIVLIGMMLPSQAASTYNYPKLTQPTTANDAIVFLQWAEWSHQWYIDNPKYQNQSSGDTQFNQDMVVSYQALIALVKELGKGELERP